MIHGNKLRPSIQIDGRQTNKIMELIESGKAEGAKLAAGGKRVGGKDSNFVEATVFTDVQDDMRIAQEEVRKANQTFQFIVTENMFCSSHTQHKKASNHHANLPLEMYSFTL